MHLASVVQWFSTAAAMIAAVIVAARFTPRITGYGFVVFTVSSLGWVAAGAMTDMSSLVVQNVVLTVINLFGVYRWLVLRS
jgi:hypothetical protein